MTILTKTSSFIDEINRANLPKVMGLMTIIETPKDMLPLQLLVLGWAPPLPPPAGSTEEAEYRWH